MATEKISKQPIIETGGFTVNSSTTGDVTTYVAFSKPFNKVPRVMCSWNEVHSGARFDGAPDPRNITVNGFTVVASVKVAGNFDWYGTYIAIEL